MSPCKVNEGTRPPVTLLVMVGVAPTGWTVSLNPIQLMNDHDEVVWDLTAVVDHFFSQGDQVADVKLKFDAGPPGYDSDLGPFASVADITFASPRLNAKNRDYYYGDCYQYYFSLLLQSGTTVDVKPVDRQIDNVAPPCETHKNLVLPAKKTALVSLTKVGSKWKVVGSPIKLENDDDEVEWNLRPLVDDFLLDGKVVTDIKLRFYHGPTGFDSNAGPFFFTLLNPPDIKFDIITRKLTAKKRNTLYGDCHYYHLLVLYYKSGKPNTPLELELDPIDPQIDNVMPPPPP